MQEQDMLIMYENAGALLNGHFILSSGRHSGRYLQSALVLMDPRHAESLAVALAAKVDPDDSDVVVSPALGGLIIGYEVARTLGRPFLFTERKEGGMSLRRGFSLPEKAKVLIVEDVVTTGGSVRECMQVVRSHGGNPVRILALVDRAPKLDQRFNVPFETLLQLDVPSFMAAECPLCKEGLMPPLKPGSRQAGT